MSKQWTRRDALRALGLTAGAMLPISSWAKDENGHPILLPEEKISMDKPVTAIVCGAGNRGNVYGGFALQYADQLDIVGVAEPIAIRNERYAQKHNIKAENRFVTWEDVFKKPKFAPSFV